MILRRSMSLIAVLAVTIALVPGGASQPEPAASQSNPSLGLEVVALPDKVTAQDTVGAGLGNTVAFQVTVSNGNNTATNVSVEGVLSAGTPSGVTYLAGFPMDSCSQTEPSCFLGNLAGGSAELVTFIFRTGGAQPGAVITLDVQAWSNQGPQRNQSSAHGGFAPPKSATAEVVAVNNTISRGFARSGVTNVFDTGFVKTSASDVHGSKLTINVAAPGTPVIVLDRPAVGGLGGPDCPALPSGQQPTCLGEVTDITITDHSFVSTDRVKVEIRFDTSEVPGRNHNNLGILVIPDTGEPYLLPNCPSSAAPGTATCKTVTRLGGQSLLATIFIPPGTKIRGI